MKFLNFTKVTFINLLAFFSVLFLLTSLIACGRNPEDMGKELSDKECNCDKIRIEHNHEKQMKYNKKNLALLQSGDVKTRQQYNARKDEIWRSVYQSNEDKEVKECEEELEKMGKNTLLTFVKEDDRKTIRNAYDANYQVCRDEKNDLMKENRKKADELEYQIKALEVKLLFE